MQQQTSFLGGSGQFWKLRCYWLASEVEETIKLPKLCCLSESAILFLFMHSKDTRWEYVVPSVIFVITGGIGMRVHSCCKVAGLK